MQLNTLILAYITGGWCTHWVSVFSVAPPAGHLDVVCLLVSQGAEISCKDKRGYTPLHTAASGGRIAVVKQLLNLAVEVKFPSDDF